MILIYWYIVLFEFTPRKQKIKKKQEKDQTEVKGKNF